MRLPGRCRWCGRRSWCLWDHTCLAPAFTCSCSPASVLYYIVQVTQLGHVKDLATAFVKILGNPRAARQVYNISGER